MLTVVPESAGDDVRTGSVALGESSSLIDEIVREGARRMLAEALQAEVEERIARFADERDEAGRRLVVRNGYHEPREVLTSAGAVAVHAPRINDRRVDPDTGQRARFTSAILPPWCRRPRRSMRCCRCCTCTACRPAISGRRWASSWARRRGCRRR